MYLLRRRSYKFENRFDDLGNDDAKTQNRCKNRKRTMDDIPLDSLSVVTELAPECCVTFPACPSFCKINLGFILHHFQSCYPTTSKKVRNSYRSTRDLRPSADGLTIQRAGWTAQSHSRCFRASGQILTRKDCLLLKACLFHLVSFQCHICEDGAIFRWSLTPALPRVVVIVRWIMRLILGGP